MSRYDNWERLVAAVLKKEQFRLLALADSSTSESSESPSSTFSFCLFASSENEVFTIPEWSEFHQKQKDSITGFQTDSSPISSKNSSYRKRNLSIQVPKREIHRTVNFSFDPERISNPIRFPVSTIDPNTQNGYLEVKSTWPANSEQRSHRLPLPPKMNSSSGSGTTWRKGKCISEGPLKNFYLGFNSETGEMCTMKEVPLSFLDTKSGMLLEKEITVLSQLKHPNIMQYLVSELVDDTLYIYFEYVTGASISTVLQEYGRLGEPAIRSYTRQVLKGLAYLHSKATAHGKLKADSILLDPSGRVKLANFQFLDNIQMVNSLSCSDGPYWLAPEAVMHPHDSNLSTDIWSLGCTIVEMATAKPPFSHYKPGLVMFKVANQKELPKIPDHLSDEGKDFLKYCLQWSPWDRATATQLLVHPFVNIMSPSENRSLFFQSSCLTRAKNVVLTEEKDHTRKLKPESKRLVNNSANFHATKKINSPKRTSPPLSPVTPLSPLPSPKVLIHPVPMYSLCTPSSSPSPYPRLNQSIPSQQMLHDSREQCPVTGQHSYWDPNILQGRSSKSHSLRSISDGQYPLRGWSDQAG